jgi:hypothetical protein
LVDAAKLVKKSIFQTFFIDFFQYWKLFFELKNNIRNFIFVEKTILETLFLMMKKNFFCFQSLSLRNLYYICRVAPEAHTGGRVVAICTN